MPNSSTSFSDPRHSLGRQGEHAAARLLKREGIKVLYRNFRAPGGGEIDIVGREGDVLVFVEVKTRSSSEHGTPVEAVTKEKQRLILRGALAWLRLLGHPDIPVRFDVVEVYHCEGQFDPHLIRNAFTPPARLRLDFFALPRGTADAVSSERR